MVTLMPSQPAGRERGCHSGSDRRFLLQTKSARHHSKALVSAGAHNLGVPLSQSCKPSTKVLRATSCRWSSRKL
jgi:hypothetical protein